MIRSGRSKVPCDLSSVSSVSSTPSSESGRPPVRTGSLAEIGGRQAGFAGERVGRGSPAPRGSRHFPSKPPRAEASYCRHATARASRTRRRGLWRSPCAGCRAGDRGDPGARRRRPRRVRRSAPAVCDLPRGHLARARRLRARPSVPRDPGVAGAFVPPRPGRPLRGVDYRSRSGGLRVRERRRAEQPSALRGLRAINGPAGCDLPAASQPEKDAPPPSRAPLARLYSHRWPFSNASRRPVHW